MTSSKPPSDTALGDDSSRDGVAVLDDLPDDLPILEEELLWLSDLLASLLVLTTEKDTDND